MAITFVNAGAEAAAASGNITLNAPASPASGDIWIAVIATHDNVAMTMDAAWTSIFQANGGDTSNRNAAFWFRYAGSNPVMTVTHSAGDSIIGGIASFRGCIASGSPIDATGTTSSGTDSTVETNAVTTVTANTMVCMVIGMSNDNDLTLPATWTAALEDTASLTQNNYQTTLGLDSCIGLIYLAQAAIGASAHPTVTMGGSNGWGACLFALKPVAAAAAIGGFVSATKMIIGGIG